MEKILELRNCVESMSKDANKFFQKNNKAAGVRARKKLQRCKKLCQEIRIKIQKTKQENFQEKSAEISALAAVNGGNSLTEERVFQENTFLPFHSNLDFIPLTSPDIFFPRDFTRNPGEILTSFSWGQENFVNEAPTQKIFSPEPSFYPSFGD